MQPAVQQDEAAQCRHVEGDLGEKVDGGELVGGEACCHAGGQGAGEEGEPVPVVPARRAGPAAHDDYCGRGGGDGERDRRRCRGHGNDAGYRQQQRKPQRRGGECGEGRGCGGRRTAPADRGQAGALAGQAPAEGNQGDGGGAGGGQGDRRRLVGGLSQQPGGDEVGPVVPGRDRGEHEHHAEDDQASPVRPQLMAAGGEDQVGQLDAQRDPHPLS
jgi:hypothetical protein